MYVNEREDVATRTERLLGCVEKLVDIYTLIGDFETVVKTEMRGR